MRTALRAIFPEVTDRAGRRLLDGILSSGAVDRLRDRVADDPQLVGQTIKAPILLSERADLYFKGNVTAIRRHPGRGIAVPSATSGDITIHSSANDFAPELVAIKQSLSVRARALRREAERLQHHVREVEARRLDLDRRQGRSPAANPALFEAQLKQLDSEIELLTARVKDLTEQAAGLQARFEAAGAAEKLEGTLPSLLVAINGGLVKITQLGNARVDGTVLLPLQSTADASPGNWMIETFVTPESNRKVSDREVAWLERLRDKGFIESKFNWAFFTSGDSREPELAGIRGAMVGSALTLLVTLILCLPLGRRRGDLPRRVCTEELAH